MQFVTYPNRKTWLALSKRTNHKTTEVNKAIKPILRAVSKKGDAALKSITLKFDKIEINDFLVSDKEIRQAADKVSSDLKEAIRVASINITKFHSSQIHQEEKIETTKGVFCWRKSVPIQNVGLYVPGGTAPLFSTVLMLAIPAKLAGCNNIILCSPPNSEGAIHPAILYAASISGVHKIFKVGGAQAIAAMAFGTESIPKVNKIFGPGNQYVTAAKRMVSRKGMAIDMPAGPSEVVVIADDTANPVFIAADLIAQAEHGVDSQAILLTDCIKIAEKVLLEVEKQLADLPRKAIAQESLANSSVIVMKNLEVIMEFSNYYAPEHLIISTKNSEELAAYVINAGSVFIGHYTPESLGDYASGTNHTLPTNGFASTYSGVSIDSFVKKITFQTATKAGLQSLGPIVEIMAQAEELEGHKMAITHRLNTLNKV